jgi:hypothetical protein
MSFHGSPRHLQLSGDFSIVAALQKQFDNLLFARTEPNSLLLHPIPLYDSAFCIAYVAHLVTWLNLSNSHSIHIAILRQILSVTYEQQFPQALAGNRISL